MPPEDRPTQISSSRCLSLLPSTVILYLRIFSRSMRSIRLGAMPSELNRVYRTKAPLSSVSLTATRTRSRNSCSYRDRREDGKLPNRSQGRSRNTLPARTSKSSANSRLDHYLLHDNNDCTTKQFKAFPSGFSETSPRFTMVDVGFDKGTTVSKVLGTDWFLFRPQEFQEWAAFERCRLRFNAELLQYAVASWPSDVTTTSTMRVQAPRQRLSVLVISGNGRLHSCTGTDIGLVRWARPGVTGRR